MFNILLSIIYANSNGYDLNINNLLAEVVKCGYKIFS